MMKFDRIYFLAALLLVFPACSGDLPEPSADFYAKQGWQQYQTGLYEEAQKNFELAQKVPNYILFCRILLLFRRAQKSHRNSIKSTYASDFLLLPFAEIS